VDGDNLASVLVVDDDPVSRMMLAHVVRRAGHHVDEAESVATALPLLETRRFDLVISDYMMPGGTGLDLLEELPDSTVPFVLLTGVMESDDLDDTRVDGVAAYVTKPFASAEMEALLERLLPND